MTDTINKIKIVDVAVSPLEEVFGIISRCFGFELFKGKVSEIDAYNDVVVLYERGSAFPPTEEDRIVCFNSATFRNLYMWFPLKWGDESNASFYRHTLIDILGMGGELGVGLLGKHDTFRPVGTIPSFSSPMELRMKLRLTGH